MKVYPKIVKYLTKNTTRARYNRHMDMSAAAGLLAGAEFLRAPQWDITDFGLFVFLGGFAYTGLGMAIVDFIKLQSLRSRALKIKKFLKKTNDIETARKLNIKF